MSMRLIFFMYDEKSNKYIDTGVSGSFKRRPDPTPQIEDTLKTLTKSFGKNTIFRVYELIIDDWVLSEASSSNRKTEEED